MRAEVTLLAVLLRVGVLSSLAAAAEPSKLQASEHPVSAAAASGAASGLVVQALEQQYQQRADPALLFKLGALAAERGDILAARDFMRRFLVDPQAKPSQENTDRAEQILATPAPPWGELAVSGDKGALIFADNMLRGILPLTLPLLLKTGEHRIFIRSGGRNLSASVTIENGRRTQLRFELSTGTVVTSRPSSAVILSWLDPLPPVEQRRLLLNVERALERAALAPFQRNVAVALASGVASCLETLPCQQTLADRNGLDWVLVLRLNPAPPSGSGSPELLISLLDAQAGDIAAKQRHPLPLGVSTSPESLGNQGFEPIIHAVDSVLLAGMSRPRGTVHVESTPPGATVRMGERRLGTTPVDKTLPTGPATIEVALAGYLPEKQTLLIADQQVVNLNLALHRDDRAEIYARRRNARLRLGLGLGMVVSGVVLLGFGISGVAADGACTSAPTMPMRFCTTVYDSGRAGGALIGVGGATLLGGILLAAWPPHLY
jgi:hypothetical protein